MKKSIYVFLGILICVILSSCQHKPENIGYDVAVVETTSNVKKSKITYYDKELDTVSEDKLHYAELGDIFSPEVYHGGEVYFVPRGLMKEHNEKKVISVNQKSGKITEYPIDRINIQTTTADDIFVYAGSNLNNVSYITQYNKSTEKVKEIELPEEYVSLVLCQNKKIYVFSQSTKSDDQSCIYIYNEKLKLENKIKIPGLKTNSIYKATFVKNKLLFAVPYSNDTENNKIGVLDLNELKLAFVNLKENLPSDIIPYKDSIVVAHSSMVDPKGTKVTVVNLEKNEQKVYDLNTVIWRLAISDKTLYVLGENEISSYDIEHGFNLKDKKTDILSEGIYNSAIFTKLSPKVD